MTGMTAAVAPIELRHYQAAAIQATYDYFAEKTGNPLVVIPTAGGKSLIVADFVRQVLHECPDERILVVTHVKELIGQNYAELKGLWPEAPAGIYSAGLRRRELQAQVLFCGIQSIHKKAFDLQKVDLILIDEAHLIPSKDGTMYRKFIADLLLCNPKLKIIGYTATPFRLDSGLLHEGDGALFTDIAYEISIKQLIDEGYLSRPVSRVGAHQIDTSQVATRAGEFVAGQLEAAASDPETVEAICDEIVDAATSENRQGILVFGTGLKHCGLIAEGLRSRGIDCAEIYGETPSAERDDIIARYKRREIRALVSMGVLTTGFNARHVDLVAVARPTKSTGLWIQMVGRGTRLSPETGKTDCLIMDFGGNILRHGPIDQPIVKKKGGKGEGEAPSKTCEECGAQAPIGCRDCPECGHPFPPMDSKVNTKASKLDLLSAPPAPPEWVGVQHVSYRLHTKPGKPAMLRVDYRCGLQVISEWVLLEHDGYARTRAAFWWTKRAPGTVPPLKVADALERTRELQTPAEIQVKRNGKYWDVIGMRFNLKDAA